MNAPAPRAPWPLLLCTALALAPAASAQDAPNPAPEPQATAQAEPTPSPRRKRRIPPVGVDYETVYLLDSKARSVFGSSVSGFGPGIGRPNLNPKGRLGADLSILRNRSDIAGQRNKFTVAFVGAEYRRAYVSRRDLRAAEAASQSTPPGEKPDPSDLLPKLLPYYGASVGAVYADVDAPSVGEDGSALGAAGSVFLGLAFRRRVFLEGRLRAATRTKGFNFSGAGLSLGVRF